MDVNITLAMMGLVAALAILCALILLVLRRHPAMGWMASALVIGVLESFALKDGSITPLDLVLVCCTIPASYICVGQSVRAAYGAGRSSIGYFAIAAALVGLSLVLLAAGAPPVVQFLFSQLAGVMALADLLLCIVRRGRKGDLIDRAQLVVMSCITAVFVARIPFFPLLVDQPTPFAQIDRIPVQAVLIALFAVLVPACVFLVVVRVVTDAIESYRCRAERDFMTDLPNRRAFEELGQRKRSQGGALVLCDIDNFKLVNDRFGHAAGDAVIRAFATLIDGPHMAARIGGEEFAIWLPGHGLLEAGHRAETLRRQVETLLLVEIPDDHPLTASFGVAAFDRHMALDEIVAIADAALYRAKNSGRNRVVMHSEDEDSLPNLALIEDHVLKAA